MTKSKKIKLFGNVKEKFEWLDSAEELRRNKLTSCDYEMLHTVLTKVFNSADGKTYCLSESVAKWCKKAGLKVIEPTEENSYSMVNFTICLE